MKRTKNKINRKISVLFLMVVCVTLVLAGCKKPNEEVTSNTSEPKSEVVTSEEVSEPASEPVSEEPEIVDGVQTVYYETYEELCTCFENLEEPVVAVFHFGYPEKGQALLYDGAHYTVEENYIVTVKTPGVISDMYTTVTDVIISDYVINDVHEWDIGVMGTGTDIEVPLTITYEDGTKETITVYITKEWKYSWE